MKPAKPKPTWMAVRLDDGSPGGFSERPPIDDDGIHRYVRYGPLDSFSERRLARALRALKAIVKEGEGTSWRTVSADIARRALAEDERGRA